MFRWVTSHIKGLQSEERLPGEVAMTWQRFEQILTVILVGAACTVAFAVVREPQGRGSSSNRSEAQPAEFIPEWEEGLPLGHLIAGEVDAPVTMMLLADLECPACAMFDSLVEVMVSNSGGQLKVLFLHFPLPYHRFAMPAAKAAECAARVGAFSEWVRAVYSRQDSLGLKSWASYANDAGIVDTLAIQSCATGSQAEARIDGGLAFGRRVRLAGTPTVILDGWRFGSVPSAGQIDSALQSAMAGKLSKGSLAN